MGIGQDRLLDQLIAAALVSRQSRRASALARQMADHLSKALWRPTSPDNHNFPISRQNEGHARPGGLVQGLARWQDSSAGTGCLREFGAAVRHELGRPFDGISRKCHSSIAGNGRRRSPGAECSLSRRTSIPCARSCRTSMRAISSLRAMMRSRAQNRPRNLPDRRLSIITHRARHRIQRDRTSLARVRVQAWLGPA